MAESLPELGEFARILDQHGARLETRVLCEVQDLERPLPVHAVALGSRSRGAPAVGFFGGVHGLERIGTQVLLSFLESLAGRLSWDERVQRLLSEVRLVFVPLVNPAGMRRGTRANGRGVDLMRNAPVQSRERVAFLVGGQRISPRLPWYRGGVGAPVQHCARLPFGLRPAGSRVVSLCPHARALCAARRGACAVCTLCGGPPEPSVPFRAAEPALSGAWRPLGLSMRARRGQRPGVPAAHPRDGIVALDPQEPSPALVSHGTLQSDASGPGAARAAQSSAAAPIPVPGGEGASRMAAGRRRTPGPRTARPRGVVRGGDMSTWLLLRGWARETRHWGAFPQQLAAELGARVITADFPGNGRLHRQRSPMSVAAIAEEVRQAVASKEQLYLLGLSLGGMVAVEWTIRHRGEVAGCVLINTSLRPFSPFYERLRPRAYAELVRLAVFERRTQAREAAILRLTSAGAPSATLVS